MTLLDHALTYAAKGWPVFPCKLTKTPYTEHGFKDAAIDPEQIRAWWSRWPDASIGWALPADVVVIDVDVKPDDGKYGDETLDAWEKEHGPLYGTVLSLTGGGGLQYFFTTDKPVKCATDVLPSIDVRTKGGYVILPPSNHPSGRQYAWEACSEPGEVEMKPLPESLYKIMTARKPRTSKELPAQIADGSRNDTLYRLACSMRSKGWSEMEILAAVSRANQDRCNPPLEDREVKSIVGSAAKHESGALPDDAEKKEKTTQAGTLLELVEKSGTRFFHTDAGDPCAAIPTGDHFEIWPLEGRAFKVWLHGLYYKAIARPINSDAVSQAIATLSAKALFDNPDPVTLHTRIAAHSGAFWYDMSDPSWRAIKVIPGDWRVAEPPLLFSRFGHQAAQPMPIPGGDITKILDYVPLKNQPTLFLCWLVSSFIPGIPHPMPIFYGEKGAAKSTTCEFLKSLIDPSALKTMTLQNDPRTLAVNLQQHWFLPFDNVSFINEETSDTLCRAVTGGGIQQRKLFTNADDTVFTFQRVLAINGINNVATRPDLLDRSILMELQRIPEDERRELSGLQEAFEHDKPAILGGILDTLADAMKIYPTVKLERLPRMADFTRWGYAIAEALGSHGAHFLNEYAANREAQNAEAIASDPVATLIVAFMEGHSEWNGTMSELFKTLEMIAYRNGINTRSKSYPQDPTRLSKRLNGIRSNLEAVGILFEKNRTDNNRSISLIKRQTSVISVIASATA